MKSVLAAFLLAAAAGASGPEQFREHSIATGLTGGYQVLAEDLDRDGDADLIALASGMDELVWFENPGWKRHVLAAGVSRMINLAACGDDGRGHPVIVLAQGFSSQAAKSTGEVLVLRAGGDLRSPWRTTEIDRLPTSHRIRCAAVDGSGEHVYVNAPLMGSEAQPPDYRDHVPLVLYRPGEWQRELIGDENEGVMHGIFVTDFDGDGRDEILTASFVGIHLYDFADSTWTRSQIARGDPSEWPRSGASDLAVGGLRQTRFIASIEPWHGNQVAVYTKRDTGWTRNVIDDSLVDGHTIVAADLTGDGRDEIIAGYRGEGRSVYLYHAREEAAGEWERMTLDDGGIACASCAVADLNDDGRPDIACIGSATANLKWYENRSPAPEGHPTRTAWGRE